MFRQKKLTIHWDFYAQLIIISYCFLQVIHWSLFPLYMDIYYHLLTAWGFIKAGGYSAWDFWQYAPFGRVHIYPPVFHIILAFFIKFGINNIILAKCLEIIMPILFLIVVWYFIRRNYSEQLSLFVLIMFSSSFSFYLSLINHLPATLALIFGILSLDQLLHKRLLRSTLLLMLCFYTHIGVSWLFAISFIVFALFDRGYRKSCLIITLSAIVLSLPMILKQLASLKFITVFDLKEKYLCEFKTIDYVLAFIGIALSWRLAARFRWFLSLFLASFIFLPYAYRFFSAEGYLPIIFLSSITLNELYERLKNKTGYVNYLPIVIIVFILFISPTVVMERINNIDKRGFKVYNFDSTIVGLIFPDFNKRVASSTLWFPNEYIPTALLIQHNSEVDDIIYCNLSNVGVCLASLSGRATANGLLPEVDNYNGFNPLSKSKIIILTQISDPQWQGSIVNSHRLIKIAENKLFIIYKNPFCNVKVNIRRALLPFGIILYISFIFIIIFLLDTTIEDFLSKRTH